MSILVEGTSGLLVYAQKMLSDLSNAMHLISVLREPASWERPFVPSCDICNCEVISLSISPRACPAWRTGNCPPCPSSYNPIRSNASWIIVIVKRLKDNAITPFCSYWHDSAFGLAKLLPSHWTISIGMPQSSPFKEKGPAEPNSLCPMPSARHWL